MKKAFSLIEVLLAASVLVLTVVPLVALFNQSQQQAQASIDELIAMTYAQEIIDQMRSMKETAGYAHMTDISCSTDNCAYFDVSVLKKPFLFASNKTQRVQAFTKAGFSPLPANYRRMIRLYPANCAEGGNAYSPCLDLKQLDVLIQWKTLYSETFNRELKMVAILGRNELLPVQ